MKIDWYACVVSIFSIIFLQRVIIVLLKPAEPGAGSSSDWQCQEFTFDQFLVADCSKQNKPYYVPDNLSPDTKVLNLSFNKLEYVTQTSFERYKELIVLDLSHSFSVLIIAYDVETCFLPLTQLDTLHLDVTCYLLGRKPRFPVSLKILEFGYCWKFKSLDLTELTNLESFIARDSRFEEVPKFHKEAPIGLITMPGSPLTDARVKDIAAFCKLRKFITDIPEGRGLLEENRYCECTKFEIWLKYTAVEHDDLPCAKAGNDNQTCNMHELDQEDLALRRECLTRNDTFAKVLTSIWYILVFVSLLFCVASVPLFLFLRHNFSKKEHHLGSEETFDETVEEEALRQEEAEEEVPDEPETIVIL